MHFELFLIKQNIVVVVKTIPLRHYGLRGAFLRICFRTPGGVIISKHFQSYWWDIFVLLFVCSILSLISYLCNLWLLHCYFFFFFQNCSFFIKSYSMSVTLWVCCTFCDIAKTHHIQKYPMEMYEWVVENIITLMASFMIHNIHLKLYKNSAFYVHMNKELKWFECIKQN